MVSRGTAALVVGCGSIGRRHARVLRQLGVPRIGLCDPVPAQLERAAGEVPEAETFASLDEALPGGFAAAFVCTPPRLHVAQARQAVGAGLDVFVEKPLAVDLRGVAELEAEAAARGRRIMVGFCFRYHEGLRRVKGMIESGRIGRLVGIRAGIGEDLSIARPGVDYRTLYVTAADVGVTLDLLHEPDFVRWIAASPVDSVCAMTGTRSDLEMLGDDTADMLIRFESGVVANVHLDFFQRRRRRESEYLGTQGTVVLDMTSWERSLISSYRVGEADWTVETLAMERDDMFRAMDGEFLRGIATREPPANGLHEGVASLQIALAARRSSSLERHVKVAEISA
jgi:predicted dehydrogenase